MRQKILSVLIPLLLAIALAAPAYASKSDTAKEQRWAEQVIGGLLDGDEVWLTDSGGHEFLGILTEGDADSGRAVILVHGIGVHPNWPEVIYPLRAGLLEQNITTLSIQMPILANAAEPAEYGVLFPEVPARFNAALRLLQGDGYQDIVIVAHSMGAAMTTYYLSQVDTGSIASAGLIGMGYSQAWSENIDALARVKIPVLDLYGSLDLETVLKSAPSRAAAGRKNGTGKYRQVETEGANHFFQEHEDALLRQVIEWLETL